MVRVKTPDTEQDIAAVMCVNRQEIVSRAVDVVGSGFGDTVRIGLIDRLLDFVRNTVVVVVVAVNVSPRNFFLFYVFDKNLNVIAEFLVRS